MNFEWFLYFCLMILFPHAKINIGLHCLYKRVDGYHELESYMHPVPIFDILEITESKEFEYYQSGIPIDYNGQPSLCEQAYELMNSRFKIQPVHIHLRKQIPIGAGLGGGSSDASFTLRGLQQIFNLNLNIEQLIELAAELGSDCPFFIKDQGSLVLGRGERIVDFSVDLKSVFIVVCNPGIHISTQIAFQGIVPKNPLTDLKSSLSAPKSLWSSTIKNDFEEHICCEYPIIATEIKLLYDQGAFFASLSGSGSTFFGLFEDISLLNLQAFSSTILYYGPINK